METRKVDYDTMNNEFNSVRISKLKTSGGARLAGEYFVKKSDMEGLLNGVTNILPVAFGGVKSKCHVVIYVIHRSDTLEQISDEIRKNPNKKKDLISYGWR